MTGTMRASVLCAIGQPLAMQSVPVPEPGPGEVLVQTKTCGICGTDLHMVEGWGYTPALPFIMGHEPAGIVADVGATFTPTGAVTVIAVVELLVVSAIDVAFNVTAAGLGTFAGALYVTEVVVTLVSVPHVAPLHPVPESDQVTPLAPVSFVKVAVKFWLPMPA